MPSKLKKAIGAVKDQTSISLAKVASNNKSNLEVAVLRATTHDDVPMDDRYVYEVVQLVSSSKVYASACARAIGKRIGRTRNWIVVLKSLMLVLRIFQDGDPYFPREVLHAMKRGAKILNLSSFRDDSNSSPWDFTAFVRTFALYLDERLDCFLTGKLQRRYKYRDGEASTHRSRRPNEPVRDMKPAMLLDKISYWQRLLERAIATRPTGAAKTNRLVQICLYAIVQESFDLYKDISDGLALLLDSFFHLQYQNCINAFQTCVKASKQFEELSSFYSQCKSIGVGRTSEYPSVQTISEELIETLQEFLKDQSSFPATTKSPNGRPLLLLPTPPPPPSNSRSGSGHDSYGGQSEFSVTTEAYSEMTSEFGSQCTSLEDLISATETGTCPAISIDLEAYSDQFEKQSERDSTFKLSDTCSTRSLPASNSMFDLVSLGDWSIEEDNKQAQDQQEQKEKKLDSISSAKGRDVMIAETMTWSARSSPNVTNSFNAFPVTANPSAQPLPNAANYFNAFPDTAPSSIQTSPQVANSFNGFGEAAIPSSQSLRPLRANSFNAFPEAVYPPAQSRKPLRSNSSNASFPEVESPSAQFTKSLHTNNFNAFPETAMQSTQSLSYVANSFNTVPESRRPPIPPSPNLSSFTSFPQTTNTSMQPFSKIADSFNGQTAHSFSSLPDQRQRHEVEENDHQQDVSRTGWELALIETTTSAQSTTKTSHNFSAFQDQGQRHKVEDNSQAEVSTTGWELALVETTPSAQSTTKTAHSFSSFHDHERRHTIEDNNQEEASRTGWELALIETTTQSEQSTTNMNNSFNVSTLDNLYNQSSLQLQHHYNPFLQDTIEPPAIANVAPTFSSISTLQPSFSVANMSSSTSTFQAMPTFSAQNPNSTMQNENDPFATGSNTFSSEQMFNSSMSQQNLLHEQQLWLQNQNKIIAKHRV